MNFIPQHDSYKDHHVKAIHRNARCSAFIENQKIPNLFNGLNCQFHGFKYKNEPVIVSEVFDLVREEESFFENCLKSSKNVPEVLEKWSSKKFYFLIAIEFCCKMMKLSSICLSHSIIDCTEYIDIIIEINCIQT